MQRAIIMVDVIRNFRYKTAGRGRGVLGVKDLTPSRRPGEKAAVGAKQKESGASGLTTQGASKILGTSCSSFPSSDKLVHIPYRCGCGGFV